MFVKYFLTNEFKMRVELSAGNLVHFLKQSGYYIWRALFRILYGRN